MLFFHLHDSSQMLLCQLQSRRHILDQDVAHPANQTVTFLPVCKIEQKSVALNP